MPDTKTSAESPVTALTGAELIRAVQAGGMVYLTPSQLKTYVQQTITLTGDVSGSGTGAITTTLANTTVIAGSYTNANVTVDAKGRLLSAANGPGVAVGSTSLTGEATGTGVGTIPTTLTNSAVIAKVLTGYVAGAGTIDATDSIKSAIQKNDGNNALKAPIASPTFTGAAKSPIFSVTHFDSGATNAINLANGLSERWAPATGAQTLTITGWPATGSFASAVIEGINLGASTITWPSINWVNIDGTFTTSISAYLTNASITLQTSGIDFVVLWTRDGGTTIYGRIVR